jgi:hypothetical protein
MTIVGRTARIAPVNRRFCDRVDGFERVEQVDTLVFQSGTASA